MDEIVRQLHFTRQIKLNGQAYFRNRFLLNNTKGIWDELQENFYTTPALIPPMTWMDSIPPSTPAMPSLQLLPDGKMHMSWQISTDNNGGLVTYHLYASDTYPVDITDAGNLLETYLTHTEYEYTPIHLGDKNVFCRNSCRPFWKRKCSLGTECNFRNGHAFTK